MSTHYPADPDLFEFDAEVSCAFDDMARRSIPGYGDCHALIARMAAELLQPGANILDLGCSTGAACTATEHAAPGRFGYVGADVSRPMLDIARARHPQAAFVHMDLRREPRKSLYAHFPQAPFGAILFGWVLQFLPDMARREALLQMAFAATAPKGFVVVMEKYRLLPNDLDCIVQSAYLQFRRNNGYSQDEIAAKTRALRNVMWVAKPQETYAALRAAGFSTIEPLYRLYNFGAYVAFKGD